MNKKTPSFSSVNESLKTYIKPHTYPLALKLCQSESELPEKVMLPVRDMGSGITLCQAIGIARHYCRTVAVGKHDQVCMSGALTMGFINEQPKFKSTEQTQFGRYRFLLKEDDPLTRLDFGKYSHLLISPLEIAYSFEPDTLVVYGNSAQVMVLTQAARLDRGSRVSAHATGSVCCGDIVARSFNSANYQVILPSGGDRGYAGTQDDEVIFTAPWNKVKKLCTNLEYAYKFGFRYPILTDIRHSPKLLPIMQIPREASS